MKRIWDAYRLLWSGPTAGVAEDVYLDLLRFADEQPDPAVRAGAFAVAAYFYRMGHEEIPDAVQE